MQSDPVADLLTRIRNASAVKHRTVSIPYSKLKAEILKILLKQQYIKAVKTTGKAPKKTLDVTLRYPQAQPAITTLKRISKPGVRIYVPVKDLYRLIRGRDTIILSTSQGIMTAKTAKKKNLGGEIICQIN